MSNKIIDTTPANRIVNKIPSTVEFCIDHNEQQIDDDDDDSSFSFRTFDDIILPRIVATAAAMSKRYEPQSVYKKHAVTRRSKWQMLLSSRKHDNDKDKDDRSTTINKRCLSNSTSRWDSGASSLNKMELRPSVHRSRARCNTQKVDENDMKNASWGKNLDVVVTKPTQQRLNPFQLVSQRSVSVRYSTSDSSSSSSSNNCICQSPEKRPKICICSTNTKQNKNNESDASRFSTHSKYVSQSEKDFIPRMPRRDVSQRM